MGDYLRFKKMITPVIIQIIFWLMVAVCVIGGIVQLAQGSLAGLAVIILGPLGVRIWCEMIMVAFSINGTLTDIKNLLERKQATTDTGGPAPPPLQ